MTRLPDHEFQRMVDDAKARHNLSDIVSRHTTLKKRGANELVGLCCFHSERTPSLEVNDNKGTYHCHGCGAGGDAIRFLMQQEGMSFRDALLSLTGDTFPIISEEERTKRKAAAEREVADRVTLARSIWQSSVPVAGTPAEVYLRSRSIDPKEHDTVRYVETPRWRDPETGETGKDIPALVCALQDANDAIVGVQCVFLDDGGRKKYERLRPDNTKAKAKLTFGVIVGSALRLGGIGEHIVFVEGPEDAMVLRQQLPSTPVWASCGTAMLPRINVPSQVRQITLAGDNGEAGRAAVDEAVSAYMEQGFDVREIFPDPQFKDWNDELVGKAA